MHRPLCSRRAQPGSTGKLGLAPECSIGKLKDSSRNGSHDSITWLITTAGPYNASAMRAISNTSASVYEAYESNRQMLSWEAVL